MYKPEDKRIDCFFLARALLKYTIIYSQLASEKSKDNILTNSLFSSSYNKLSQRLLLIIISFYHIRF